MPSFAINFHGYTDRINIGFYGDLRGLNIESDIDFIGSGGIGLTYHGDGEAGSYNTEGKYAKGRYSLSAILQGATGKKEIIQSQFNTDKNFTTSVQTFFLYNSIAGSNFGFKIGYQYFFDTTTGGSNSNFSISLSN